MASVTQVIPGETVEGDYGGEYIVKAKCEFLDVGHWWCVTHDEGFANPMERSAHTREGDHRLAWVCHYHGPEQP